VLEFFRQRRPTIVALVLVTIALLTIDIRGSALLNSARRGFSQAFSPVRDAGNTVSKPFETIWHGIFDYSRVKRENDDLRDQVDAQKGIEIAAQAQTDAYAKLREQVKLPAYIGNAPTVLAEVTGRSASNFEQNTFEINAGAAQGVKPGMPVITSAGLVGRVSSVTNGHTIVRLITDPTVGVSVKVLGIRPPKPVIPTTLPPGVTTTEAPTTTTTEPPTTTTGPPITTPDGSTVPTTLPLPTTVAPTTTTTIPLQQLDQGLLRGQGRNRPLGLELIGKSENVQVGNPVFTAGDDNSLFFANIVVGNVSRVSRDSSSLDLVIEVTPVADLNDLSFVRVILYDPLR
jgi:cell shape-determining protein MreC